MRLLLNSLRTGASTLIDAPAPGAARNHIVIATSTTLVSAGTERMIVQFGAGNLLTKARSQPDKVKQVLAKMHTDGVMPTLDAVRSKLDEPIQLGYANVGRVIAVGEGVTTFKVGDRVVSNAPHAEIVRVAKTMATRVPPDVSDDSAAFATIGAIGLQAMRLAAPTLGETVVVYGLGLIGLITVQLLLANGCRVFGIDLDPARCRLAEAFGAVAVAPIDADEAVREATAFSRGRGVDCVIITATTTSDAVVHQAAQMSRHRGRIVLAGVVGLNLLRDDFYKKELSFQVSASYGPGRYDPEYEGKATDYPFGLVRWTQGRNIEAVMDMMAAGRVRTEDLVSHRFNFTDANAAYQLLTDGTPSLGILLDYGAVADDGRALRYSEPAACVQCDGIGVFGAGNYASRVLIPSFIAAGAVPRVLVAGGGPSGPVSAKKFGFAESTTDAARVFESAEIGTVVIATRHDSHADLVLRAIETGKHVFVEKPLCLTLEQLDTIEQAYAHSATTGAPILTVGFNRRFAPTTIALKSALDRISAPKCFVMIVNAGAIPVDHWTQDDAVGGGRLIGEACHFIDLLRHLAGAAIKTITVVPVVDTDARSRSDDRVSISLSFADGSIGTVHYFANGHSSVVKERLEVFAAGRVYRLENFRMLSAIGDGALKSVKSMRPDKGQNQLVAAFVAATKGAEAPIPVGEIFEVARASILAADQARQFAIEESRL